MTTAQLLKIYARQLKEYARFQKESPTAWEGHPPTPQSCGLKSESDLWAARKVEEQVSKEIERNNELKREAGKIHQSIEADL